MSSTDVVGRLQTTTAQHACCLELACKLSVATHAALAHTAYVLPCFDGLTVCQLCYACCCLSPSFHHTVSSGELLRYSGLGRASAYAHTLAAVSSSLNLTPTFTIASLCIRHACPAVATAASHLLTTYQQRLSASLPPAQRTSLPLSSPPITLAAFYCTARQQHIKLDSTSLRQQSGVRVDEWRRTLQSYNELVGRESGMADEHRRREERAKRKRKVESSEYDEEAIEGQEVHPEAAAAVPKLAGSRTVRYAEWRQRVVEKAEKDEATRRAKRRRQHDSSSEGGNEDDECEYGDGDERVEVRRRRAPLQSRLNFSIAASSTQQSSARKVDGQGRRGGYTDVVVL